MIGEGAADSQSYLIPAFYFRVSFASGPGSSGKDSPADNSFLEVSGISAELETEDVSEGGENRYVHRLPKGTKFPKLVLKRGIADMNSPLVSWCQDVLEGGLLKSIEAKQLTVSLLNENAEPVRVWSFVNAYPVGWEVEGFNSTKNDLAIEKIELSYNYSNRMR